MKGVQGPGSTNRSEITVINEPVRKPIAGPYTKPLMKVKVSVKPTFIRMPKSGPAEAIANSSNPIRTTAPIAINVEASAKEWFEKHRRTAISA